MMVSKRHALIVGFVAVLAVAPVGIAAAGAATVKDATLSKVGVLTADGAATKISATFVCPQGYDAFVTLQVIQAQGEKFAGGFDQAGKTCTGKKQKVSFYVQAVPAENTAPFRSGSASARMILDAVDPEFAGQPFFEEEPVEETPPGVLPPLPFAGQKYLTDAGGESVAPQVHAEDRRTIRLRTR
ncbi:MAG: hypothetical protein ACT4P1_11510 [Sporichthyaceae bacterium]